MHTLIKDSGLPRVRACAALGIERSTSYRQQRPKSARRSVHKASHRRLNEAQRDEVLSVLHSPRFCDQTPAQTYHTLLGEGIFLASIRTMQRLLKSAGEARERRPIRPAQTHAVPRLQATAPNQVWTWDITKLALRERGRWLYLYVLIDLYSRYVVGWMMANTENSALACRFVGTCAATYQITPNTLTVHQDRGAPMTASSFIALLAELKIDVSHSRPRVSNDNAFSEAHFKTLKTQPDYPAYFNDSNHARSWCGDFFDWYNDQHQHSGLNGHIPADVFHGRARAITGIKQTALDDAHRRHPERFVNSAPKAKAPPDIVSINPLPASVISLPTPIRNAEIQSNAKPPARSQAKPRTRPSISSHHTASEVAKLH
jgi:putative transposase